MGFGAETRQKGKIKSGWIKKSNYVHNARLENFIFILSEVESFRFLGTIISQDLKWDNHIDSIVKKAQQRLYFLRQLRKFNLPQELLIQFYSAVIESVLCTSITVWFGSATKSDIRRLQRTVRTAERIIGAPLPTLQDL